MRRPMRVSVLAIVFSCSVVFGILAKRAHADFWGLPSEIKTIAAMQGHGWPNHFDSCFGSSWGLMKNNCGGPVGSQRLLIIPMEANGAKYTSIWVRASGNGSNGMTNCQGISPFVYPDGQRAIGFTQIVSTNVSSSVQYLNLGSIDTLFHATFHFECFVAQGGGTVFNITTWED